MRSVRLSLIAKLTLNIGLLSCIIGACTYCAICMPEVLNIPFDWRYLAVVGVAALGFTVVSAILFSRARAAAEEEARAAEEARLEAQALEDATAADCDVCAEPCEEDNDIPTSSGRNAVIKVVALIVLPVAIACVSGFLASKSAKKKVEKQQQKKKEKALKALKKYLEE